MFLLASAGERTISVEKCFKKPTCCTGCRPRASLTAGVREKGKLLSNRGKSAELELGWRILEGRGETEKDATVVT